MLFAVPDVRKQTPKAAKRVLTGNGLKACRAHATRYQHQLDTLRQAAETGQKKKIRGPQHKALTSLDARVCAVILAAARKGKTLSYAEIHELAENLDVSRDCGEPVGYKPIPKDDGSTRCIFSFGIKRTALQTIVRHVLDAQGIGSPYDYARQGRGREAAVQRILTLPDKGYRWFVTADIHACFDSLNKQGVKERLPMPGKVIEHTITIPKGTLILCEGYRADRRARTTASRLGAPQGAITSGRVAAAVLAPELDHLAAYGEVLLYGDDILVATSTYDKALAARRDLKHLLERHPAGPLRLNHTYIRSGDKGYWFDYIGYRFERTHPNTGSYFRARPSKKSFYRFQRRAQTIFFRALEDDSASDPLDEVERYAAQGKAAHRSWHMHPRSEQLFELTLIQALTNDGYNLVSDAQTDV